MEITRKKVNFINRQKMLLKVKTFWDSLGDDTVTQEKKAEAICSSPEKLEEFDRLVREVVDIVAVEVVAGGKKMGAIEYLDNAESHDEYIGLFNTCIAAVTPRAEGN